MYPRPKFDGYVVDLHQFEGVQVRLVHGNSTILGGIKKLLKGLGGSIVSEGETVVTWSLPCYDLSEVAVYLIQKIGEDYNLRLENRVGGACPSPSPLTVNPDLITPLV